MIKGYPNQCENYVYDSVEHFQFSRNLLIGEILYVASY